ncbi:MAG: Gfo/Idh/MocA family oxidoreductase [Bryobacteraceae bacterium]
MQRREFLLSALAAGGPAGDAPVRMGVIGTGNRGRSLLSLLVQMKEVQVKALGDLDPANLERAEALVTKAGGARPESYSRGELDYRRLLARDDLDAVVIATPWKWHTPMAVDAMKAGKATAVEVPASQSIEECWALIDTHERTKAPCMMLENWSFRRDNLAVLNMIRAGLLGEIVHCHCAHSHDCIDHWFWDPQGQQRWSAEYLVKRNCDQYPTHGLGPVLSWMDINCGDSFATISSSSTGQHGINTYFARKFGPDHPNAKRQFAQGDIVTSVLKTRRNRTVVVNYDMQLPRPYDNRWMIQGTLGLYDEDKSAVYLEGRSPKYHEWEPFGPYQSQFDHAWYKATGPEADAASHGGTDWLELSLFVKSVRDRRPLPLDLVDGVTMSAVVALSGESIAKSGTPVEFPDFTRGAWKTRKPGFAV